MFKADLISQLSMLKTTHQKALENTDVSLKDIKDQTFEKFSKVDKALDVLKDSMK
jgi:hypothetical protein